MENVSLKEKLIDLIKTIWSIRFVRFLFVGGLNTLFSYVIYAILILLNVHYTLATLISTILGIIFNFFTTGSIVFRNRKLSLMLRFFLVYGFTYLVNILLLSFFETKQVDMLIAGAIVTLPVALLSYFLNAKLVFRESKA